MVLHAGDRTQVIYPSGDLSETGIRASIESALRRAAPGFLKVVGIWTPPASAQTNAFGQQQQSSLQQFQTIQQTLGDSYEVRSVDLSTGQVPSDVDALFVIAPQSMTDRQRYAIDQYLMRGGSIFLAVSPYRLAQSPMDGTLTLEPVDGNLSDMLASYGITVEEGLVLDPQNEPFPVPVQRNVGGMPVTEIQAMDYPPFVDIRADGMARENPVLSDLPAITVNWASPITVNDEQNADRQVIRLLESSPDSWHTSSTSIQPQPELYKEYGFPVNGPQQRYTLAAAVQGSFESFFKDKEIPVETDEAADTTDTTDTTDTQDAQAQQEVDQLLSIGKLERSPETARLVVVGSAEFLSDTVFQISSNFSNERYLNNLQFVQNTVDWFNEDTELAAIRSKGAGVRLLEPITESEQTRWEIINYVLALVSLGVLGIIWRVRKRAEKPMPLVLPDDTPDQVHQSAAA
jgi:ABC-2 type transport system permease protein